MSNIVQMHFAGNRGYTAGQIDNKMTLGDLLAAVQEAVDEWGEDAELVLHQTNNGRGANYGALAATYDLFSTPDEDGEDY